MTPAVEHPASSCVQKMICPLLTEKPRALAPALAAANRARERSRFFGDDELIDEA